MNVSRHRNRGRDDGTENHEVEQSFGSYHRRGQQYNQHHNQVVVTNRSSGYGETRSQQYQHSMSEQESCRNHPSHHQRYSFSDEEDRIASQHELRKKTKELHQILNQRKDAGTPSNMGVEIIASSRATRTSHVETVESAVKSDPVSGLGEKDKRLKHVHLVPDHRSLSGNESSGVEMCKKLFGITVFEYSNGKANWNHMSKDRKLVVQGVIEGSKSHLSGRVHRGDMLVRINDMDVSWLNFTRLLSSLNKREKVKLTFQSPRIVRPKSSYSLLQVPEADLCLAVLGKRLAHIQSELSHLECAALYLTLVPSSSETETDEKEDIIYAFPPGEENIMALRGLFMTLSSALVDVVGQPASCTHIDLKGTAVNVAYKQYDSDVLMFVMPENRISADALAAMLDAFVSLMVLLFADVKSAFSDCDRTWLDKLLALMFHQALSLHSFLPSLTSVCPPLSSYGLVLTVRDYHAVKVLNLSYENKLICDEILSEFEALDFDDYLEPQDLFSRRQFTVHGASLFYKDHLLCSHLFAEQQKDVNLFLNCQGLLALSSRQHVETVMVWQEFKSYVHRDASLLPAGYRPSSSRTFLMIVGLNHYYLVVLVEAGGCSHSVQGQARPLPLLVDQGRATLAQLETEEVHMSGCCEERLTEPSESVLLASADQLCKVTSPRSRSSGRDAAGSGRFTEQQRHPSSPTKSFAKNPFARSKSVDRMDERDDPNNAVVMRRQGSKLSYGSNDSAGSGSSTGPPKSKGSRVSSMADISSIARSMSVLQIDAPHDVVRGGRLTRGRENALFSFLRLDSGEGIIISPTDADLNAVHSTLQQQVMDNFCLTCHKLRTHLREQRSQKESELSLYRVSSSKEDSEVKEAGTLFHCTFQSSIDKKQQITTLQYWVVGRRMPSPESQELYVCFHESASQALVEMAFSLGFGT